MKILIFLCLCSLEYTVVMSAVCWQPHAWWMQDSTLCNLNGYGKLEHHLLTRPALVERIALITSLLVLPKL